MDPARYEVVPIGIARDGRWYLYHNVLQMLAEVIQSRGELRAVDDQIGLLPQPGAQTLVSLASGRTIGNAPLGAVDVVFPVLHGPYGEDGTVQGLLELADIPYVGAGVLGSAVGIDKDTQKRLLRDAQVPVVRFAAVTRAEYAHDPEFARRIADEFGYPVFVKPNTLGSSVGVNKASRPEDLAKALEDAFQYDRKVLIEAACQGHEFECSVLGNDDPEASLPGELIIDQAHEFYSYESKYIDPHGASYKIPAELPQAAMERIRALSIAAFKALSLRGMARVDFLASRDLAQIFVNEANTIPGFTSISMYPKLWEVSGLPMPRLIDRLIELALDDHRERSRLKITYGSGTS